MKRTVYVDMDNVLVDFASAIPLISEESGREFAGRLDEVPGIFALMDPMPHGIESFEELSVLFDTYILSTAPWENPSAWSDKLLWVKRYLGKSAHKRLILSHHKNLCHGDFLVDDRTAKGANRFSGELILFGSAKYPDWPTVMEYLRRAA